MQTCGSPLPPPSNTHKPPLTCCRWGGVASRPAAMASGVEGMDPATPTGAPPSSAAEGAGSAAAFICPSATLAPWKASVCTRSTAAAGEERQGEGQRATSCQRLVRSPHSWGSPGRPRSCLSRQSHSPSPGPPSHPPDR